MSARLVFTAFAVVVVLIGSMEGWSNVLRGRVWPFGPATEGTLDALLGAVLTITSFVSLFWLYRTWSPLWTAAVTAVMIVAARGIITRQSLNLWLELRPLAATATVGSAALLWFFAAWP